MRMRWMAVAAVTIVAAIAATIILVGGEEPRPIRAAVASEPFTFTPAAPRPGESVTFTAAQDLCLADQCSYAWYDDRGNGPGTDDILLATTATPTYTRSFVAEGTKYVRLRVTSSAM